MSTTVAAYEFEKALHDLRKIAAIAVRGMIFCGVRHR